MPKDHSHSPNSMEIGTNPLLNLCGQVLNDTTSKPRMESLFTSIFGIVESELSDHARTSVTHFLARSNGRYRKLNIGCGKRNSLDMTSGGKTGTTNSWRKVTSTL